MKRSNLKKQRDRSRSRVVLSGGQTKSVKKNHSLLKGLIFIGIYVLVSLVLEMINFKMLGFGILPENILFDLAFLFVVSGFLFLIPNNIAKIVIEAVLLAVQIFVNLINATLIKNTGLVFHWNQLTQAGNAATSLESDMVNFGLIFGYILVFASFLVVTIVLERKLKNGFDFKFSKRLAFWLACSFGFIAVGTSFMFIGRAVRENVNKKAYAFADDKGESLADGIYFKNATFRVMGTFGYYFHDAVTLIDASKINSVGEINSMKETLKGSIVQNEDGFSAKGDNLIYILLESFDSFSLDPYNTPNLWKLAYGTDSDDANDFVRWGYNFEEFYGLNYTNNSEYISLTGHTTEKNTIADYYNKTSINMPYSLPNLFKGKKYQSVNYFHGYSKEYYNRNKLYSALGFENVYGLEDADMKNKSTEFGDWVLDSEYIEVMMDKFIPEGKSFFSYYTTISTHGPYDDKNDRLDKYEATYDENLDDYKKFLEGQGFIYPEDKKTQLVLREYKSAVMDTDVMIGMIFERLAELQILDTTTIIMFADHNCFYNDLNAKIRGVDTSDFSNIKVNNIPLIIYNDELAARSSQNFCNTYDLYATVCHMFGLEYNSLLTQGYSVFKKDIANSVHVSFKHGIYNKDFYTEDLIRFKQISDEPTMTLDEFKKQAYEFFKKQEIIEFVYRNKLYSK